MIRKIPGIVIATLALWSCSTTEVPKGEGAQLLSDERLFSVLGDYVGEQVCISGKTYTGDLYPYFLDESALSQGIKYGASSVEIPILKTEWDDLGFFKTPVRVCGVLENADHCDAETGECGHYVIDGPVATKE